MPKCTLHTDFTFHIVFRARFEMCYYLVIILNNRLLLLPPGRACIHIDTTSTRSAIPHNNIIGA